MNVLLRTLCAKGVIIAINADNLFIPMERNARVTMESRASETINEVYEWVLYMGVEFSKSKIVYTIIKEGIQILNR